MSPLGGGKVWASRVLDVGIKGRQNLRNQNTQAPVRPQVRLRLQSEAEAKAISHNLKMS